MKGKDMYESKRKELNYWHGLGTGIFIAFTIGFVSFGITGDRNKELGRIALELREEQERVRILKESIGGIEHNLVIERIANKDIRRDFREFLDSTQETISGLDTKTGDTIAKLRRTIEALKVIAERVRSLEDLYDN